MAHNIDSGVLTQNNFVATMQQQPGATMKIGFALTVGLLIFACCFSGCSQSELFDSTASNEAYDDSDSMDWNLSKSSPPAVMAASPEEEAMPGYESENSTGSSNSQSGKPVVRKIIYTANISLVVEVFDDVESRMNLLVQKYQGFISSSHLDRYQGAQRSGTWVVRIPVDQFEPFLSATGDMGQIESKHRNSSDVTEEFVDLNARIENKKKLEARIIELLERPDDKIQHVIEVERELARVREDIERMEGRLRYLTNQTSLTTVTLNIREERNYTSPQSLTLTTRVQTAWSNAVLSFQSFLADALVSLVRNIFGIAAFLLAATIIFLVVRRRMRKLRRTRSAAEPAS